MQRKEHKTAPRYSLIVETSDDEKFYYDTSLGTFVQLEGKKKPKKESLSAIDTFTSFFHSIDELAKKYSLRNINKI